MTETWLFENLWKGPSTEKVHQRERESSGLIASSIKTSGPE